MGGGTWERRDDAKSVCVGEGEVGRGVCLW